MISSQRPEYLPNWVIKTHLRAEMKQSMDNGRWLLTMTTLFANSILMLWTLTYCFDPTQCVWKRRIIKCCYVTKYEAIWEYQIKRIVGWQFDILLWKNLVGSPNVLSPLRPGEYISTPMAIPEIELNIVQSFIWINLTWCICRN